MARFLLDKMCQVYKTESYCYEKKSTIYSLFDMLLSCHGKDTLSYFPCFVFFILSKILKYQFDTYINLQFDSLIKMKL